MPTVITQPSVAPFVQQAALALQASGQLKSFCTTVAYQPEQQFQSHLFRLTSKFKIPLEDEFRKRSVEPSLEKIMSVYSWRELARLAVTRVDRTGVLTDLIWEWAETGFDRWVASLLDKEVSAVYGYEHACHETFCRAKDLGIRTIYDVPAPETTRIREMMADEIQKHPELDSAWFQATSQHEPRRLSRRQEEWAMADRIICASEFTRSTFQLAGYDTSKVRVVPYGCPPTISETDAIQGGSKPGAPLRLLWAGSFNIRKGAHYLLEALKQLGPDGEIQLDVYGRVLLPPQCRSAAPQEVHFYEPIRRELLFEKMAQADALIFPTLYDGFGMVLTEALSRGLPVITTSRAGASSLIHHEINGLICEPGSIQSLEAAIRWCVDNRAILHKMRPAAVKSAARWQWKDYRTKLIQALE